MPPRRQSHKQARHYGAKLSSRMKAALRVACVVALCAATWTEAARAGLRTLHSPHDEAVAVDLVGGNVSAVATSSPLADSAGGSNATFKSPLADSAGGSNATFKSTSSALVPGDAVNLCEGRTGCRCTGATFIKQSPRQCVLVRLKTTIAKNWDPFSNPTCSFTRTETAYDCSVCPAQLQYPDVRNGNANARKNVIISDGMLLNGSLRRAEMTLGKRLTQQREWCVDISDFDEGNTFYGYNVVSYRLRARLDRATCVHKVEFRGCRSPTRAPTPRVGDINAYAGWWDLATTSGSQEITVETVFSTTSTQEQEDKFTSGWEVSSKVAFKAGLPLLGETEVEVTGKYSSTMEITAKTTLAVQNTQTHKITCAHTCDKQDYVYVWKIQGYDLSNTRYKMDVPSCLFQCIDPALQGHIPPQCPPTYCGHTEGRNMTNPGTCACCTSLEWADRNQTNLPPLCPGW